jgi:glycerophosphoryl diester phosphodiesterase
MKTSSFVGDSKSAADPHRRPEVIAHRGACGYLPEHTLAAKAMAYAMGADYLEQDVVLSQDDQLIVIHDITLDRTTDVATKFPGRCREDGHFYVIDFTLVELLQLDVHEATLTVDGKIVQQFSERFPVGKSVFKLHTLAQEIELVQGLNVSTGQEVGIYPEIKSPGFHCAEGKDLSTAIIKELKRYGYTNKEAPVYVQTFDFDELKRVYCEVFPALGVNLKLVQLLASTEDAKWQQSPDGLRVIAEYADGIGPEKDMVIGVDSASGEPRVSSLVSQAHALGLKVHPYTFRADEGQVPPYANSFEGMLELHIDQAGIDGLFTDFTDRAVAYIRSRPWR